MADVQLAGVAKTFPRGVRAVEALNLDVRDGELLVLVGPSGCGKSTTLRLIAGLETPTAGEIRIGGERVNSRPPAQRNVAMVFQYDSLLPHLNVRRNLRFGLEMARGGWVSRVARRAQPSRARVPGLLTSKEIDARVDEAAKLLAIEPLLHRRPRELSGGERQRVALGRAIVRRPCVFLLDEPLSHLDLQLRSELRTELKRLHARLGTTMIYVTHDQHEALTLGDRLAVMAHGRVLQTAEPLEVYDRPAHRAVAGFLGDPPMNFWAGKLAADGGVFRFVSGTFALNFPRVTASRLDAHLGQSVTLGIRPEQVQVHRFKAETNSLASDLAGSTQAMIDMVEALGDSTILRLRLEENATSIPFTAKLCGRTTLQPGNRVEVVIDAAKCHWFHTTTGENLILK